jgi:2-desacetyl-2-hydroxyethyl bacteriochlorophyllide A dehydrogenase
MKAIVIPEAGKVEVQERPMVTRKKGEALLKLLYGGVCGSDLGTYRGTNLYTAYPCVIGHEFSAEVVEVEPNEFGIKEGMLVTCNPYFNCGTCYSCRRGLVNCCTGNQTMGVQREGAFAEYISMPIERIYEANGIEPKLLALIEPFCISNHAVSRAAVKPGDRVLVMGCGTIGLLAAVSAKLHGGEVYISDISEDKLAYAEKLGIEHTILNESKEKLMEAVLDATAGDYFDVCIEATGVPEAFINCIDAAAFQGRVVDVGVSKRNADFKYTEIQRKELNIMGSRAALKSDFIETINYVKSGKIDLSKIISREYAAADAEKAFEDLNENSGSILKMVFKF